MEVLIDLDMPAHELGHIKQETGEYYIDENGDEKPLMELVPFWEIEPVCKGRLMSILINTAAGTWRGFLSRGKTFRDEIATILPYKGHREGNARDNVDLVKQYYAKRFGAEWCEGYEADDAMSMVQWDDLKDWYKICNNDEMAVAQQANTVIASRDKDLDTVPGWHYKWWLRNTQKDRHGDDIPPWQREVEKGDTYWVTKIEALRNFYKQLLMGDTADNIPGIYGVGEKSAWIKQLDQMDEEEDMFEHVEEKYNKHYRNYGRQFMIENGQLLWMWRRIGDDWIPPDVRDEDWEL